MSVWECIWGSHRSGKEEGTGDDLNPSTGGRDRPAGTLLRKVQLGVQ